MILGLTHVGITVSDLDRSIALYRSAFGFKVVSDAPRSGPFFDSVYGASNARARLVYLSIGPCLHFELFHFQNPPTLPATPETNPRPETQCCVLQPSNRPELSGRSRARVPEWISLPSTTKARLPPDFDAAAVMSPDYYLLEIVTTRGIDKTHQAAGPCLMYPVVVVGSLEKALAFYQGILGMNAEEPWSQEDADICWKFMTSPWGRSLLLIEPRAGALLPCHAVRWQRPGYTHIAFAVRGIDDFCERRKKEGVKLWFTPHELRVGPHAGGKTVFLSTPDGLAVELLDSPLTRERADAG